MLKYMSTETLKKKNFVQFIKDIKKMHTFEKQADLSAKKTLRW